MAILCLSVLAVAFGFTQSARNNYTITEEVFLDIEIKDYDGPGDDLRGRIVIGLFGETAPMTAMNFAKIANGFKLAGREKLHYKNTYALRLVRDFIVQFGDVVNGDGTINRSIYGDKFVDENFILSHRSMGMVSMANQGRDSNGSQFIILLSRARWLDGTHVLFGKVVKGMNMLNTINDLETDKTTGLPKKAIKIIDCGTVGLDKSYALTEEQIQSEHDILE